MLTVALALCSLAATPSAADFAGVHRFEGALVQRLRVSVEAPVDLPLEQMTKAQLYAELERLDAEQPSLAGPILGLVLSGVTIGAGLVTLYISFILALVGTPPLFALVIGAVVTVGGGALLAVAIVMLRSTLAERRPFLDRAEEIRQHMEVGNYQREPSVAPPPPPPVVPTQAGYFDVAPSFTVARF